MSIDYCCIIVKGKGIFLRSEDSNLYKSELINCEGETTVEFYVDKEFVATNNCIVISSNEYFEDLCKRSLARQETELQIIEAEYLEKKRTVHNGKSTIVLVSRANMLAQGEVNTKWLKKLLLES